MLRSLLCGLLLATSSVASEAAWLDDPAAAFAKARADDSYVFVDLYADWCGWCKVLEDEVFVTDAFRDVTNGMTLLRVDVEDGDVGSALQADYEVRSLPTTLVLDGWGGMVAEISGYAPADAYVAKIRGALAEWDSILEVVRAARERADADELRVVADRMYARRDGRRAAPLYERLLELVGSGPVAGWIRYRAADAHRMGRDWAAAAAHLESARSEASLGSQLREQLDLLAFTIARDQGSCDDAKQSLERFLQEHPTSSRAAQAAETLALLREGGGPICAG